MKRRIEVLLMRSSEERGIEVEIRRTRALEIRTPFHTNNPNVDADGAQRLLHHEADVVRRHGAFR